MISGSYCVSNTIFDTISETRFDTIEIDDEGVPLVGEGFHVGGGVGKHGRVQGF